MKVGIRSKVVIRINACIHRGYISIYSLFPIKWQRNSQTIQTFTSHISQLNAICIPFQKMAELEFRDKYEMSLLKDRSSKTKSILSETDSWWVSYMERTQGFAKWNSLALWKCRMCLYESVRLLKDSTVKFAVKAGIEFIFRINISTCNN